VSLMRQLGSLLLFTLLLTLLGGAGVNLLSAHDWAQIRLQLVNDESAARLALALSRQPADHASIESLLAAEFTSGAYQQLRFDPADGGAPFVRERAQGAREAPGWFERWAALAPVAGRAQVFDGVRALGTIEVTSSVAPAHDDLWGASVRTAAALGATGLAAGLIAALVLLRVRRALGSAVGQAQALLEGRFITRPEPPQPELRSLTGAMNAMVGRLKAAFDVQAAQLERLHHRARCDGLTGLSNRSHFLAQLEALLGREDGAEQCGLVLLRLRDLDGVNRAHGRAATDRILCTIAQTLRPYGERVPGCMLGRLNGADFALCLPAGGVALESAQALAAALRAVLPGLGQGIVVALGAVELNRETPLADALAAADEALARAEARGPYEVELGGERGDDRRGAGETAWRQDIGDALTHGRVKLVDFPVIDSAGELVHLECLLRLQLQLGGAFEVAAHWLPLAVRARLTSHVDACAVALALAAIARDGKPRCVNLAPASLAEGGFAPRLRGLLFAAPRAARKLSFEVAEAAAVERFASVQELSRQMRPCGVRLGLEHAGARLGQIERLFDAGLEFVKLDAAVTRGVGRDLQRMKFVQCSVELLHSLSLQVYAEGVCDDADARALWACGVDAVTGPWATERMSAVGG
jgi:EAL domain-containing protein (putative c-di-GMP-specific phosphodiesterase class I)/GGDEF domain-containing protein